MTQVAVPGIKLPQIVDDGQQVEIPMGPSGQDLQNAAKDCGSLVIELTHIFLAVLRARGSEVTHLLHLSVDEVASRLHARIQRPIEVRVYLGTPVTSRSVSSFLEENQLQIDTLDPVRLVQALSSSDEPVFKALLK